MIVRFVNGEPRPGREFEYWLAWKHRSGRDVYYETPKVKKGRQ